ncbi:amidohydrolase family protein [Ruegeria atlantica]|uniref:amidohydrolase family protein n=1 Tax=Ruegeria atlantica TaxID=81569 RepID=UPI00147FA04F|nr:amidohydrolase family protein [Ruegeria atlantica]
MRSEKQQFDVVLSGGRVIDPETYTDRVLNVGIADDTVAAISTEPLEGKEVVDVTGLIVAPGFIDLHAHGQNIASNRIQAFDGLTTALELEAGMLPVSEFYDNCAAEGRPINFGCSAGWAAARIMTLSPGAVSGGKPEPSLAFLLKSLGSTEWVENPAHGKELDAILALTEQGLREGAIGIGCPWGYTPGAGLKELRELWLLAKKYNQPTYTHIQNMSVLDPNSGTRNVIELAGLAASTGARTHICHWNSTSLRDIPLIHDIVRNAQKAGLPITTEAYVYGAGNSGIGAAEWDPVDVEERMEVEWSDFTLVKTMKDFETKEEFVAAREAHPEDSVIVHFLHEDDDAHDAALLDISVLFPGTAICTDGLPFVQADGSFYEKDEWPLPEGLNNHPRAAGNYARFFRKWVRERGIISWMDAIRQTSLNPALILEEGVPEMKRKGRLQEGSDADVVVFDPETIGEKADFKNPSALSVGMRHVLVNGKFLIRNAELDPNAMAGRAVRARVGV